MSCQLRQIVRHIKGFLFVCFVFNFYYVVFLFVCFVFNFYYVASSFEFRH